MYKYYDDVTDR